MTTDRLAALRDEYAALSLPLGSTRGLVKHERDTALWYMEQMVAAAGVTAPQPAEEGPCVRCGYLRDSGTHDTAETCDEVRGPCLDPQRHHPYQSGRRAPAALDTFVPLLMSCCHDMRLSEADIRVLSARLANSPATLAQPAEKRGHVHYTGEPFSEVFHEHPYGDNHPQRWKQAHPEYALAQPAPDLRAAAQPKHHHNVGLVTSSCAACMAGIPHRREDA